MHTASEEDAERLVSLLYNLTKCVRIPQIPLDSPAADAGDPSSSLPHPPPPYRCYNWPCHVDAYFRYAPDMCLHHGIWSSSNAVDSPGEPPLLTDWLRRIAQGEAVSGNTVCGGCGLVLSTIPRPTPLPPTLWPFIHDIICKPWIICV